MGNIQDIPLISSEIGGLWNTYMSDSMLVCVLKYFLNQVKDNETRGILQQTCDLSKQHIQELTNIFDVEKLPVPNGFTDSDVNIDAPRLYTDAFYLQYLGFMSRASMHNYTLTLNHIARSDMRAFFAKRIYENIDLFNNSADLRLSQGIFIRAPRVEVAKEVQFIKSKSFLLDWFGEKRPLLATEITYIFASVFSNIVGRAIATGFGQVSKEQKNSKYYFEGKTISSNHIGKLTSILTDEGIPIPSASDSYVNDSTVSPFSEKLMLNHTLFMAPSGISNLGMAIAGSMRSDLQTHYIKAIADAMKYSKDGVDILIDNGWLEQPPQAVKHENLVL